MQTFPMLNGNHICWWICQQKMVILLIIQAPGHEFWTANSRQLPQFIYIYNYNNTQCNCSQCAQNQQCTVCKVICILCSQVYFYHLLACTAASMSVITDSFTAIVRISSVQFYSQLPGSSYYSAMPTCVAAKMHILMLFTPLKGLVFLHFTLTLQF